MSSRVMFDIQNIYDVGLNRMIESNNMRLKQQQKFEKFYQFHDQKQKDQRKKLND